MTPADRALAIAARIADGSAIDWAEAETGPTGPVDPAIVEELRAISALASLHRAPADWPDSEAAAVTRWGSLTLLGPIAAGRFGQVYRAWDARLQRQVALKLLHAPSSAASDSPTKAIDEARLLARVRHPNVLIVHGAECLDGQVGIWTEFIEGQTLEAVLADRGPLPAEDLISLGVDLCRALAAVHDAGLLHRDIKAQNVMRETGGRIVLMDFGTGHDVELVPTSAGDLSGTPLYLAPELFTGGRPTVASDVYALAVLLFHLSTGEYPVPGRTLEDVRTGHRDRRSTRLRDARPDLPASLVEAIDCGLAVNPSQRFESARGFEAALTSVFDARGPHPTRPDLPSADAKTTAPTFPRHALTLGTAVLILGAIAGAVYALRPASVSSSSDPETDLPLNVSIERLTFTDDASLGAISPDGKLVAYVRANGPNRSLWVHQVATGTDVQIASLGSGQLIKAVTVTPDSSSVDFMVMQIAPRTRDVWRVPILGGSQRRILTSVGSSLGWSPDAKRMAFVRHPVTQDDSLGRVLVVADADGSNQRQLATHSAPGMFLTDGFTEGGPNRPVWSPDGSAIALLRLPQPGVLNEVVVLDSTTGTERQVRTIDGAFLSELAWLDESRLLVNRHDVKGGPFQIWVLDLHTGASTPLTRDVSDYRGVTLRADREVAVSTISDTRAGVWLGGPAGEDMRLALQETAANPRGLSFDRNGRLAYEASTDTGRGIWTVRPGLEDLQFVVGGGRWPALTPDGRLVYAADGRNSTGQGLWVRNADGSQSTRLVEEGILPAVAPDGDTVYFISTASGSQNLWSVRLTGGAPQRVSNRFVSNAPRISPDGRRVMFQSQNGPNPALVVCDLPHCDKEITRDFAGALFRFAPDGRSVAYLSRNNTTNIWIQPVAGGLAQPLTHFTDRIVTDFAWSPDGKVLAVTRQTSRSNIVLLKGLR